MSESKGGTFVGLAPPPGAPKGLLDAISEIEQYAVIERNGSTIRSDFLTTKGRLGFFEVGMKGSLVSGLVSTLFTPVSIGVVQKYIPIFGSYNPTLFDQIFALLVAISFSAGYAALLATVGKCYIGEISKTAVKSLVGGFISGTVMKTIVVFMLFHFLYIFFSPERLGSILVKFKAVARPEVLNNWYYWLLDFRSVFLVSAYFVVATSLIAIFIPVASIWVRSRTAQAIMDQEAKWQ